MPPLSFVERGLGPLCPPYRGTGQAPDISPASGGNLQSCGGLESISLVGSFPGEV